MSLRSLPQFYLLICTVIAITGCTASSGPGGSQNAADSLAFAVAWEKPNILLIMVDDLGFNDLAINNQNPNIHTPNMDQLAREGMRFTRHYAHAVCSPARAALLSGMHPERLGYQPAGLGISPDVVTLPEKLREEGYTTYHIGKWHTGHFQRSAWPDHQGFDHWFGFIHQWRLAGEMADGQVVTAPPRYNNPYLEGDTEAGRHYQGHLETLLTDKAIDVLSTLQSAGDPWFLNLWYYAPHGPVSPASDFARQYPDTKEGRYRALVNQLDHNIGNVMAHLSEMGALDNTIVVVVSDNGGTNQALDSNAPYHGKKATLFEGALRTPLIIRWPDATLNNRVVSSTIAIQDLYPTLVTAIGARPPANLDGVSHFASIINQTAVPERTLFWEFGPTSYSALSTDGRWRLYQLPPIWGANIPPRLYDLEADSTMQQWQEPPDPEQLAAMLEEYQLWYRDVHTVRTEYLPGENGGMLYGMDFMRTPGYGGYTFGIGVPPTYEGQVAAQEGIWNIQKSGTTITASFGEVSLSSEIQHQDACHSVVVTGYFHRPADREDDRHSIRLGLHVDKATVESEKVSGALEVIDSSLPTVVGEGLFAPPVVLNVALDMSTPWTLGDFAQALCDTPGS